MGKYDDIINLPHHQSLTHPHMGLAERAAQFSPYSAVTGYDALVKETARLTDRKIDLSEEDLEMLDRKLRVLQEASVAGQRPTAAITYFVPDEKKDGGSYQTITGKIRSVNLIAKTVIFYADNELSPGEIIKTGDIISISGELIDEIDNWQA